MKIAGGKECAFKAPMTGTAAPPHGKALKVLSHTVTQLVAKEQTLAIKLLFVTVVTQK